MKINHLVVKGFRCLKDCAIDFDEDLTVIVGENDCGKTSLIDCLRVVTQNKGIEIDDFHFDQTTIYIEVEIENMVFIKEYEKNDNQIIDKPLKAKMQNAYLLSLKIKFNASSYDLLNAENDKEIREFAKLLGITVRSNIATEKLRERINEIIDGCSEEGLELTSAQFPSFNNILLDGKQFENVSAFFKEVFLREKQTSIWQERVDNGATIEEIVKNRIDNYSEEISAKMRTSGIIDKMKMFLPSLTDIKIEPIYQTRDLNIDAKVKFLEGDNELPLQKKGDGTKRRITIMALLEFKKEQNILENDKSTIYLLDEPDTHLHVRAQIQMLNTLKQFCANGNQVVITTHSPFIMNAVSPAKIRMMSLREGNSSIIKCLKEDKDISAKVLQSIGIENLYIFFEKILILVEGETEETFIPNYFFKEFNETLSSQLAKIINVKGIKNVYGFAKGILELHDSTHLFIIYDNDASDETRELIEELHISNDHKFLLGTKEFEDSFQTINIYNAWKKYLEDREKRIPDKWNEIEIDKIKAECTLDRTKKFSFLLKGLTSGSGAKFSKPLFGELLADEITIEVMPEKLKDFFRIMRAC